MACARRIGAAIRPGDLAARLGGDEFAILLPQLAGRPDAGAVARRLCDDLAVPFRLAGTTTAASVSVGLVLRTGEQTGTALLAAADQAMYRAKQAGGNRYVIA